jgi:thymidylate synthase
MIPGEFIHTFGDVHIYDNHKDAVSTQIVREPKTLPEVRFTKEFDYICKTWTGDLDELLRNLTPSMFEIEGYDPHPKIKAKLSTGLK